MPLSEWERLVEDLRSDDRAVRAASVLARVADESRVPDLYRLLGSDDCFVREAAAEPLARLEGARALPALFTALTRGESEGYDNDSLVGIISELLEDNPQGAAPLVLQMVSAPEWKVREHAAWALGFLPSDVALEPLLVALSDESPDVRSAAAGSLGSFEGEDVLLPLIECLRDDDKRVRVSAADALRYLGDRHAVPALREALDDPDNDVRLFAAEALRDLQ